MVPDTTHPVGKYAEIILDFTYRCAIIKTEPGEQPRFFGTYVDDYNSSLLILNSIEHAHTFLRHLNMCGKIDNSPSQSHCESIMDRRSQATVASRSWTS